MQPFPEPEDTGQKEVYAFFGLCSYYAQVFKQGVVNLAVGLRVRGLTTLRDDEAISDDRSACGCRMDPTLGASGLDQGPYGS